MKTFEDLVFELQWSINMKYKYKDISLVKAGDIVEYQKDHGGVFSKGNLFVVEGLEDDEQLILNKHNEGILSVGYSNLKLLDTKPGLEAKVGDTVICIKPSGNIEVGDTFTQNKDDSSLIYIDINKPYTLADSTYEPDSADNWCKSHFLVLQEDEPITEAIKDNTKEIQMAKVGDKVIDGNRIETITKVDGNSIWVSNTNDEHWVLNVTWKLYTGDAEASNTKTKENTMNQEAQISIAMTAKEYKAYMKSPKAKKPLTKLEEALLRPIRLEMFNTEGTSKYLDTYKSAKAANKVKDKLLQSPTNIGCTVVIFSDKARAYTTSIPIVEVK